MNPITMALVVSCGLFMGLLVFMEIGFRVGRASAKRAPESQREGFGAVEGAIFGLLGLLLAFSFGGAADRMAVRRGQIVDEANAIGTAWLRLDLLPSEARTELKDLFRRYLDSRLAVYANVTDLDTALKQVAHANGLQGQIWQHALDAGLQQPGSTTALLVIPALNDMFDIATTRTRAAFTHTSPVILGYLAIVALLAATVAGYSMSSNKLRPIIQPVLLAALLAATLYLILDLDYPRLGLIRLDAQDQVLSELRQSMN